ncbi:MAG: GNAT family N-acetyltransferase [Nocardioides sp.]
MHSDHLWIDDGEDVVGFVRFTWCLNERLRRHGGHIGYSVRPSRRYRGYATRALALTLDRARQRGLGEVLLTCDDDNLGSIRVIERNGGVLDAVASGSRFYRIPLRRVVPAIAPGTRSTCGSPGPAGPACSPRETPRPTPG